MGEHHGAEERQPHPAAGPRRHPRLQRRARLGAVPHPGKPGQIHRRRGGGLLECFQWNADYDRQALTEEMADVYAYLLMLADRIGVDLNEAALAKYEKNKAKYPVEKAKGNSAKYDELD